MKDLLAAKETALSWLKPVSREILNWFQKEITVQQKADQSPVTIADQRAEEMLRQKIHRYFPDHGIIGEEFGEEEATREWVWTVDPIDGTRSFIQGLPLFATLLSLLHKGEPVMGIICLPAMGETVWAVKGKGTYSGDRRLHVSSHSKIKDSVLATADLYCFPRKKVPSVLEPITFPGQAGENLSRCVRTPDGDSGIGRCHGGSLGLHLGFRALQNSGSGSWRGFY